MKSPSVVAKAAKKLLENPVKAAATVDLANAKQWKKSL
jgi:hypothetical protein